MEKRWKMRESDPAVVDALRTNLNIHPAVCTMLVERGISGFDEAKTFFRPTLDMLHDPFLMKDMQKAVERIDAARKNHERVLIYGDYDVDGTTAVGCMHRFLAHVFPTDKLDFYIPHRYREGYGVSKQGIDYAASEGFTLMIALDCGIKSVELIGYAKSLGIDFIVCDHHLPGSSLPPAVAILNPKQSDCNYPYKELCGCGVGLKLVMALTQYWDFPTSHYLELLDLAATAVAADIVPITGENRVIAYFGLEKANTNPSLALKVIMDVSGVSGKILIHHLVFMVAPRVNAAGRMDDARKVIELFTAADESTAKAIALQLQADNTERKEADQSITQEALDLIRQTEPDQPRRSTVVYQPHWHKGVVGIVASRLIDHYYRPTIVLTKSGDLVAGSARSIPGFNIHDGLEQCSDLLLGFGGHYFAAGMTMNPDNVEAFARRFNEIVTATVPEDAFIPELLLDAEVRLRDLTMKFYDILTQMEPFGPENPQPVFVARGLRDLGHSKVVKDLHLRLVAQQNGHPMQGIGFNMAEKIMIVRSGFPFDVAFHLDVNEWLGKKTLQMRILDLKPSTHSH
ncbi:MAG: single-stranded-DNA-specific exonuclease RecJ [Sphingobacteriales bacterium]|nr:MAG: single-stranded-DNA-specific exonuclease RecJ [Sphingobacteriales bacterium]